MSFESQSGHNLFLAEVGLLSLYACSYKNMLRRTKNYTELASYQGLFNFFNVHRKMEKARYILRIFNFLATSD